MSGDSARPFVFGEVLFDRFDDGSAVLGGAPFNVAWHLQGFGQQPLFISGVGDDADGRRVLEAMAGWGMDTAGVQINPDYPTGVVRVALQDGQPTFDILPDRAYDFIDASALRALVDGRRPSLLYHGSLIARNPVSRSALFELRRLSRCPVFVDINLRPPWWDGEFAHDLLEHASWCKLNEQELAAILQRDSIGRDELVQHARELARRRGLALIIVTLGADGAWLVTADEAVTAEPVIVSDMVDAVGAGDAFSAVSLYGLMHGWDRHTILSRALVFAAEMCRRRGATVDDPQLYQQQLDSWD